MKNIDNIYAFILELDKLKLVFRNTVTANGRHESTAEHSWSASMIAMTLMTDLKKELGEIDELKVIKLVLIHDIVEIYAGDVIVFDAEARKNKEAVELEALHQLMQVNPEFGQQLSDLWHEFEAKETLEAKIAKACDSICPVFQRLATEHHYGSHDVTMEKLEKTKIPNFAFSKTFSSLFQKLKHDLLVKKLIAS